MPTVVPRPIHLASIQCYLGDEAAQNIARLTLLIQDAAQRGAQLICLPELLEGPYFCQSQSEAQFARARALADNPTVAIFAALARRLQVVLTVPFFEKDGPRYYNSVTVVDADGTVLHNDRGSQVYRKSHIPQGPGYEEKFFFRPGHTGFTTWKTAYACVGVGICWDQWYPEAARSMMLRGADVLFYPTAIGAEPTAPGVDTQPEWQLAMQGHAVHNRVPVVAANRFGKEGTQQFYGSSFIANHRGEIIQVLSRDAPGIAQATVDLAEIEIDRAVWGFFRDRRPELYTELTAP